MQAPLQFTVASGLEHVNSDPLLVAPPHHEQRPAATRRRPRCALMPPVSAHLRHAGRLLRSEVA